MALIDLQLDVLFARDREGRLVATRDPEPQPAPRLFVGRSAAATVWAVRHDVDPATRRALAALCAAEPPLDKPSADSLPRCRDRVLDLLGPIASEWRGPAYVLPNDLPGDHRARLVSRDESDEWRSAFPWVAPHFAELSPVAIAFDGGRPAALCHSPRGRTRDAAEAGVETLERFRRRGLATAAVACWARAVQRSGRVALYSTSWDNAASQRIAQRLGATPYGEDWHVT